MRQAQTAIQGRWFELMATGDVFAVKLRMTFADQECRPGFYLIEGNGSGEVNPVHGCALTVKAALGATPLAGFSVATLLTAVEVQDVQPGTGLTAVSTFFPAEQGDVADDNPVPPQNSMLIRWLTDFKGGKGKFARRGRTYVPGIYSTGQISGFLTEDLQSALSAFASLLFNPFVSDGTQYQMNAVSFVPNSNPRVIREFHPITDFGVDNVVDTQRPRRPGRGI